MNRRRFLECCGLTPAVLSQPLLSACSSDQPLTVAIHPWVGYETLYISREFNWLPAGVRLHEGKEATDSITAVKAGKVDAACLTLDEVLRARADGMPLSVVLVFDVSTGADVVIARANVAKLADLKGKRLGYEQSALGALVLQKMLDAANLSESDLTLVNLPPDKQLDAWRKLEVDAVITYEPTATQLLRSGGNRVFDSRRMPDMIFDVLAIRQERLKDSGLVKSLVSSHFRGLEHIRSNREDAVFRISARENLSPEEVRRVFAGVILPSLAANRAYLHGQTSRLVVAANMLSALMAKRGLLPREDRLDELVRPDMLPGDEK